MNILEQLLQEIIESDWVKYFEVVEIKEGGNRMVKEIPLQNGMVALVDDEDYDRVNEFNWKLTLNYKRYSLVSTRIKNKTVYLQRFIVNREIGKNEVIVFENKNDLDFRKSNLKITSRLIVQHRRVGSGNATSKYKGVSWDKNQGKWRVQLKIKGTVKNIGRYVDEDDAALAYNEAALKFHGEHAFQNVIGRDSFPKEKVIEKGFQPRSPKSKVATNVDYRGIYKSGKKWAARIKGQYLGSFDNEIDAARAYDKKAKELFGEKAILNFLVQR